MPKILKFGKWVPHLSKSNIDNRMVTCIDLLSRYHRNNFLWRIVTGDEKWIRYDNSKRKKPSKNQQGFKEASIVTQQKNQDDKVLLCIWWDQKGVLYYELLQPGETVSSKRYSNQLTRLNERLFEKRLLNEQEGRKVILLHDNARPHVSKLTKQTVRNLSWDILPHPAYSPDLAPTDYWLFRSLQQTLTGKSFKQYGDIKKCVEKFIASKPKSFFYDGINQLPTRWMKVVENEGMYFDEGTL